MELPWKFDDICVVLLVQMSRCKSCAPCVNVAIYCECHRMHDTKLNHDTWNAPERVYLPGDWHIGILAMASPAIRPSSPAVDIAKVVNGSRVCLPTGDVAHAQEITCDSFRR